MANRKVTGKRAASSASKAITSQSTVAKSKTVAGRALSRRKAPKKQNSSRAVTAASKTLPDKRASKASKAEAGSVPVQKRGDNYKKLLMSGKCPKRKFAGRPF